MAKEIEIANGIITVREFGYPEYRFRIFTGTIPYGYQIWSYEPMGKPMGLGM